MIVKQRRAWTSTSSGHEPSGKTGAVPETRTRSPMRTAREKPMVVSKGEPEAMRRRGEAAPVVLREEDAVLDPAGYADVLTSAGCEVDAWETTYLQRLTGEDPVLDANGNFIPGPDAGPFIPSGRSATIALTKGTHRFQCCIHPWMQSTVTVR